MPDASHSLALILALDAFGEAVLADWEATCFAQDPSTQARFKSLHLYEGQHGFEWGAAVLGPGQPPSFPEDAQAFAARKHKAFAGCLAALPDLRRALETALHALRSHTHLLQTGLGRQILNLDVFLLADLTQPTTAGVLPLLMGLVGELLAREPYGMGHVLACTALFPEEHTPARQAALFVTLYELVNRISPPAVPSRKGPRPERPQPGTQAVGDPWRGPVYLFDHRKEGSLEAFDQQEIHLLVGNFLQALLLHGIAQNLPAARLVEADFTASAAAQSPMGTFCTAGTTVWAIDPERLQETCAVALGLQFLQEGVSPAMKVEESWMVSHSLETIREADTLGDPVEWGNGLCAGTPFRLLPGEAAPELSGNLPLPDFSQVPESAWIPTLRNWWTHLETEVLPHPEKLDPQPILMKAQAALEAKLDALLRHCFPMVGGFPRLERALQSLEMTLDEHSEALAGIRCEGPRELQTGARCPGLAAGDFAVQWENQLQELASLLRPDRPKERPSWKGLARLLWMEWQNPSPEPRFLSRWGRVLLNWFHADQFQRLTARDRCVQLAHDHVCAVFLAALQPRLQTMGAAFRAQIGAYRTEVERLRTTWISALEQMETCLAASLLPDASPFRALALDAGVVRWLTAQQSPAFEALRGSFAERCSSLLDNWRHLASEELRDGLLALIRPLFQQSAGDISLAAALIRGCGQHLSTSPENPERGLRLALPALLQGTTPLLRASFDACGGGGEVVETRWLLTPLDLREPVQELLRELEADWQVKSVENRQTLMGCHVRAGIPLACLELLRPLQRAYLSFGPSEQASLWLDEQPIKELQRIEK